MRCRICSDHVIVLTIQGAQRRRVLVGRPEGKRPLGRTRRRWEDNTEMNLMEIRIDGANSIQLGQDKGSSGGLLWAR
jgi:hypothetical protein